MTKDKSILIKNIYWMLCYALGVEPPEGFEFTNMETTPFDNIYDCFARILSNGIGHITKRGLQRDYREKVEDLSLVHGKIDMRGTMRNQIRHQQLIACRYDDLSEDTLPNRILKSSILLLLKRTDVDNDDQKILRKELFYFSHVQDTDLKQVPWNHLTIPRNNRFYEVLLAICYLLTKHILLTTEEGNFHLPNFKGWNFSKLYEKFILGYYHLTYADHVSGFSSEASKIEWSTKDDNKPYLPGMWSDITLTDINHKKVLIIDAKFYKNILQFYYGKYNYNSKHLYQIFTYVVNKAANLTDDWTTSGILLYAKTQGESVSNKTFQIYGHSFSICTLDLNQDFADIKKDLDTIFRENFPELATEQS